MRFNLALISGFFLSCVALGKHSHKHRSRLLEGVEHTTANNPPRELNTTWYAGVMKEMGEGLCQNVSASFIVPTLENKNDTGALISIGIDGFTEDGKCGNTFAAGVYISTSDQSGPLCAPFVQRDGWYAAWDYHDCSSGDLMQVSVSHWNETSGEAMIYNTHTNRTFLFEFEEQNYTQHCRKSAQWVVRNHPWQHRSSYGEVVFDSPTVIDVQGKVYGPDDVTILDFLGNNDTISTYARVEDGSIVIVPID